MSSKLPIGVATIERPLIILSIIYIFIFIISCTPVNLSTQDTKNTEETNNSEKSIDTKSKNKVIEKKEIICELEGSFSVTYRDLSKTVISEGLDFFKNLATQTQQSIFLINKAKTNFDKDDWQKESLQVVQYWEIDESDNLIKLNYTFDPSPIWVNPKANWSKKISENGIEVVSSMTLGEDHPLFDNYSVEYYGISNSINWYTGKGRIFGDIWLKSKDGGKNKNPKLEILAKGNCTKKERKF